jgi:hypothetical protein
MRLTSVFATDYNINVMDITTNDTSTVPLSSVDMSRLAKTGCSQCHGAGFLVYAKKANVSDPVGGTPDRYFCRCVQKRIANRTDIVLVKDRLHWAAGSSRKP